MRPIERHKAHTHNMWLTFRWRLLPVVKLQQPFQETRRPVINHINITPTSDTAQHDFGANLRSSPSQSILKLLPDSRCKTWVSTRSLACSETTYISCTSKVFNPLWAHLNSVIGTLAVDGWAVTFGTAWADIDIAVPNVTAHPSTASVPTSYYSMWHYSCLCTL